MNPLNLVGHSSAPQAKLTSAKSLRHSRSVNFRLPQNDEITLNDSSRGEDLQFFLDGYSVESLSLDQRSERRKYSIDSVKKGFTRSAPQIGELRRFSDSEGSSSESEDEIENRKVVLAARARSENDMLTSLIRPPTSDKVKTRLFTTQLARRTLANDTFSKQPLTLYEPHRDELLAGLPGARIGKFIQLSNTIRSASEHRDFEALGKEIRDTEAFAQALPVAVKSNPQAVIQAFDIDKVHQTAKKQDELLLCELDTNGAFRAYHKALKIFQVHANAHTAGIISDTTVAEFKRAAKALTSAIRHELTLRITAKSRLHLEPAEIEQVVDRRYALVQEFLAATRREKRKASIN